MKRFKSYQLPRLPPKCYKLSGADNAFLSARQEALQRYLDILSSSKDLCAATEVKTFVGRSRPTEARDVVTLPKLPDMPAELPDEAVKLLEAPRAAIRTLFLFQQSLEVDQFLVNRLIIIDSRRRHFIGAQRAVKFGIASIEDYLRRLRDPGGVNLTTQIYMSEVLQVLRVCAQWAETVENEEGPLIRELLPSAKDVRPISWYQAEVAQLFRDSPCEDWPKEMPAAAKTLLAAIKKERHNRATVRQSVAVEILKQLQRAIQSRNSEIVDRMYDKNGAADPTRDAAPGLDRNLMEQSLPPPEITLATFQNRARTAIARMDTLLVELGDTADQALQLQRLCAFEADLSRLLAFVQQLKKSPEITGRPAPDSTDASANRTSYAVTTQLSFEHPDISSDEDDDVHHTHSRQSQLPADLIGDSPRASVPSTTTTTTTTLEASSTKNQSDDYGDDDDDDDVDYDL